MTISRAAAQTMTQLIARVRREVADPSTDQAGNAIPAAGRRFSDSNDITPAINDALITLGNIMAIKHSGEALVFTDITYADAGDNNGMDLPSGIGAEGVYYITDITDPTFPIEVFYLHPLELEQVPVNDTYQVTIGRRYYSLAADATGTDYRILIRPNASSRTFRIHWVATPFVSDGTGSDTPLLSARWRELIGLEAAINLMAGDEEGSDQIQIRYGRQLQLFRDFCSRQKRPTRVKMNRRLF